jgi:regulator of protease activity HflC (stomatin/prohibitin superfamily)
MVISAMLLGFVFWFVTRYVVRGFYTVDQNERAVKMIFGRAERVGTANTRELPMAECLTEEERERYDYPQLRVIPPGGPYFRWPWETVQKVSVATQTVSIALDLETPNANSGGNVLDAVTKDHLNTGLTGQLRYRIAEQNLYAYLFGVRMPIVHVLGYFVSVLRERIANFEAPDRVASLDAPIEGSERAVEALGTVSGVSINDLRKNLRDINEVMDRECAGSAARYGISLDACLITGIDPPAEVDSALAAINTAHNHVSSEISLAQASADQRIVSSKRAVEINTLRSKAEAEPLLALAEQIRLLRSGGKGVLEAYLRNIKIELYKKAQKIVMEARP